MNPLLADRKSSEEMGLANNFPSPACTICGVILGPKNAEKYQLRWENKNAGACQTCVVKLRKGFKTHRNKTPVKYRREELFLEDCDIAALDMPHHTEDPPRIFEKRVQKTNKDYNT